MPSRKSLPPGTARIMPIGARIRLVEAAFDARKTHFSHMSCRMVSLAAPSKLQLLTTSAMARTVEQRDDRGTLAYRRRERLDRIVEVVSLAAQQHDVKLVLDAVGLDDRRILQRYVSVRAFDHEARGGKLQGAARSHQKGDVAAGLQHPAAEISANGPGANDENAHLSIPLVVVG